MESPFVAPVVVGVDGSASSVAAVRLAAVHAASRGCPLHVVHAFNWLPRWRESGDRRPDSGASQLLRSAAGVARDVSPDLVIVTRLLEGPATSTLLRQARAAALLAVGDGGLPAPVCLPTISSALQVAARAACSVLVARASSSGQGPIVVGVNGSPASEQALDFAFDTAARRRARLVVVRAATSDPDEGAGDDAQRRALADLVAPREDKYHLAARIQLVPGEPEAVLVAAAGRAGLVIVGARGQRPYGGLLGSAAQALLHHSPAPVILVRGRSPLDGGGRRAERMTPGRTPR